MSQIHSSGGRQPIIAVCGASQIGKEVYQMAVELGREIAKAGFILACGGLFGTMEAVCQGAKLERGLTLGILPSKDKSTANSYVDIPIPTGMGEARNAILVATADAVITVAGGAGTLSEIALAWRAKKPIIALIPSGGWSAKLAGVQIDDTRADTILSVSTPHEAVNRIITLLKEG